MNPLSTMRCPANSINSCVVTTRTAYRRVRQAPLTLAKRKARSRLLMEIKRSARKRSSERERSMADLDFEHAVKPSGASHCYTHQV